VKSVCCDREEAEYEVMEIPWLSGRPIENFVREMILYSIRSESLSQ